MAWVLTQNNFDIFLAHNLAVTDLTDEANYSLVDGSRDFTGAFSILSGVTDEALRLVSTDNLARIAFQDNDTTGWCGVENSLFVVQGPAATIVQINLTAAGGSIALGADGILDLPSGINIGTTIDITGVLDEDTMVSDSAVKLATQQSIKAYVDATAFPALPGDPGFDATLLWDDSASNYVAVAPGTGLSIDATPQLNIDTSDTNWIHDTDDMTEDSATHAATQQSIKAYVDNNSGGGLIENIGHWAYRTNDSSYGGTRSSGWTVPPLNVEISDGGGFGSLNTSNYQVTLNSGYYFIYAMWHHYQAGTYGEGKAGIHNVTSGGYPIIMTSWRQYAYDQAQVEGFGYVYFTVATAIRMYNYANVARASYGLGWNGVTAGTGTLTYTTHRHLIVYKLTGAS
jgi:hypothetical protein